jgi:translation initiation factor IF-2
VRILGLRSLPLAGQEMITVESELRAKDITSRRERVNSLRESLQLSNVDPSSTIVSEEEGESSALKKDIILNVILKADGVGTLGALEQIVKAIQSRVSGVVITVADKSVGDINVSDIETASNVGNVIILGFNIGIADASTRASAKEADVKIVRNSVIYR